MSKCENTSRRRGRRRYERWTVDDLAGVTSGGAAAEYDRLAQVVARSVREQLALGDTKEVWLDIRQGILNGIGAYHAQDVRKGGGASSDESAS